MHLHFTGLQAIVTAETARMMPLVVDNNMLRPARSLSEARRLAAIDPSLVTFNCYPRPLIEAITGKSIPVDADLVAAAEAIPSPPCPADVRDSIIQQIRNQP